jgi:hypothetical protein
LRCWVVRPRAKEKGAMICAMTKNRDTRIDWPGHIGSMQKLTAVFSAVALSGCEIAGDIFQAGVWVGVLLVVGIIALVIWMVSKAKT